jgi:hypothetical protein
VFDSRQGQDSRLLHSIQTGSGTHPAPYAVCSEGAVSPGVKRQRREADHLPLSSAEVRNSGAVPPLLQTSS